jgi:hypothetical protein
MSPADSHPAGDSRCILRGVSAPFVGCEQLADWLIAARACTAVDLSQHCHKVRAGLQLWQNIRRADCLVSRQEAQHCRYRITRINDRRAALRVLRRLSCWTLC